MSTSGRHTWEGNALALVESFAEEIEVIDGTQSNLVAARSLNASCEQSNVCKSCST